MHYYYYIKCNYNIAAVVCHTAACHFTPVVAAAGVAAATAAEAVTNHVAVTVYAAADYDDDNVVRAIVGATKIAAIVGPV